MFGVTTKVSLFNYCMHVLRLSVERYQKRLQWIHLPPCWPHRKLKPKKGSPQGRQLVKVRIQQLVIIAGGVHQSSTDCLAVATAYMLQYLSP
ncbi:TPA: hypothetical protein ACH3X2_012561 [Trebouxia sp. C0005]